MQDGTKIKSGRGRPRSFDKEQAMLNARRLFQENGYSGTSLDELAKAMGIKRSSLNNTFGSKSDLYLQTLKHYEEELKERLAPQIFGGETLATSLQNYFSALVDIYCQDNGQGCFFSTSLPCVVHTNQAFKEIFLENHQLIESMFLARLSQEQDYERDKQVTAQLLAGVQHSLSLRAKGGIPKDQLNDFWRMALDRIL